MAVLDCSPEVPALLARLGCSVAISTYHNGRIVLLQPAADPGTPLALRSVPFENAMAMAAHGYQLTVTGRDQLAKLNTQVGSASAAPTPQQRESTGAFDIHGLGWSDDTLWAVNTRYSCLGTLEPGQPFTPRWTPPFITALAAEDRCHLNGMAMTENGPGYVTMLGDSDGAEGWRERTAAGGVLMDVASGAALLERLPMPHSPRLCGGELYVLLSATGEVVQVDVQRGGYEVITRLDGFARGMDCRDGYLFVGMSRLRKSSRTFRDLPVAERAVNSGLQVIEAASGRVVGAVTFDADVEEVFDVLLLPLDPAPVYVDSQPSRSTQ